MLKHHNLEKVKELGLDDLKENSFESLFCLSTKPLRVQEHSFYTFFRGQFICRLSCF